MLTSGEPGLYICDKYVDWSWDTHWEFINYISEGDYFKVKQRYLTVNPSTKKVDGFRERTSEVTPYADENLDYGFEGMYFNGHFTTPAFKYINTGNVQQYAYGWKAIPQDGAGLSVDKTTGNLQMQCPIERTEDTVITPFGFDSTNDVLSDYGGEKSFGIANNQTKDENFYNAMTSTFPATVQINVVFDDTDGNNQNVTWTADVVYALNDISETIRFSNLTSSTNELHVYYRTNPQDANNGLVVANWSGEPWTLYSITFQIPVGQGTYTYQTQLPIEAIECDKTVAGTYTLQCTVDAQGNKTYAWV